MRDLFLVLLSLERLFVNLPSIEDKFELEILFKMSSWYNLITAITNITCIFPIYRTVIQKDWIMTGILLFVSIASVVLHLAENHKDVSTDTSWLLSKFYVAGFIMTIGCLIYLYYMKFDTDLKPMTSNPILLFPLLFLRISEYGKYNSELQDIYLVTRSIWHLSVFLSIDYYLKNLIYS